MAMLWRISVLVILGIINVILFYRMMWGEEGLIAFSELRQSHAQLEQELIDVNVENLRLSQEIRLLTSDDVYLEKMIRQQLHYVRDNEILYLFTEEELPQNTARRE